MSHLFVDWLTTILQGVRSAASPRYQHSPTLNPNVQMRAVYEDRVKSSHGNNLDALFYTVCALCEDSAAGEWLDPLPRLSRCESSHTVGCPCVQILDNPGVEFLQNGTAGSTRGESRGRARPGPKNGPSHRVTAVRLPAHAVWKRWVHL